MTTPPRKFKGYIVSGEPVTTKHGIKAGIIKNPVKVERKCKNCLYLLIDGCGESKGPDDYCEYFST